MWLTSPGLGQRNRSIANAVLSNFPFSGGHKWMLPEKVRRKPDRDMYFLPMYLLHCYFFRTIQY